MWDFFWLPEGEQPTRNWRFTLHLSYHFWIWRWVNNLELILPPYVTFLQTRTVTSSSLSTAHTHTPLSLLRCSHWKHTFSAAILWCSATCRICEACMSVFWISKWWNCDVKLKHYIFCTHTETHAPILAFAELRSYPWLSGAHCPHMMLHLWHVHVSLSVDISILHN